MDRLPKPVWTIEGLLPGGAVSLLYGAEGIGKSFLALDWMLCTAGGHKWCGRPVRQGAALYLCAENAWPTPERARAWSKLRGLALPQSEFFVVTPEPVMMAEPRHALEFLEAYSTARRITPAIVVVDTLQRSFVGHDENSTKDMTLWVAGLSLLLQRWPLASVMVIHHSGKDITRGDRGSSVLRASVECRMELRGSAKSGEAALACHKQKNAPEFKPLMLQRHGGPEDGGFIFIPRGLSEFEERILAILREEGEPLTVTGLRVRLGGKEHVGSARVVKALENLEVVGSVSRKDNLWEAN